MRQLIRRQHLFNNAQLYCCFRIVILVMFNVVNIAVLGLFQEEEANDHRNE